MPIYHQHSITSLHSALEWSLSRHWHRIHQTSWSDCVVTTDDNWTVFTLSLRRREVKMIWTLYKSELSAGNNGAKWSKWRQWLGSGASGQGWIQSRDRHKETEREGTFWMKTNVKTIKAIFPLINSPHWLLGLLSLSDLIQSPNGWGTRCPSVIGFGLGGQENTKIDAQCH